jgi:CNT family concentrative nucleoside transporter
VLKLFNSCHPWLPIFWKRQAQVHAKFINYIGTAFLFGEYNKNNFAATVLPAIIFFCAFISVVYYFGGMQYIVMKMAYFFMFIMDTSGSESVVAAASPFVGQGESALLVRY